MCASQYGISGEFTRLAQDFVHSCGGEETFVYNTRGVREPLSITNIIFARTSADPWLSPIEASPRRSFHVKSRSSPERHGNSGTWTAVHEDGKSFEMQVRSARVGGGPSGST